MRLSSTLIAMVTPLFATPLVIFAQAVPADVHPPIPIRFHLDKPAMVTLVIEDAKGVRVRNLLAQTPFPAGDNTTWWDGLDDRARDGDAASHSVYHVPGTIVPAGTYRVRGLLHDPLDIKYEFTPYFPGNPPWQTADRSSGWLADHEPPSGVCFLPAGEAPIRAGQKDSPAQVLLGSFVAEGGSGIAWVDLEGHKLHGQLWLGGVWTGAEFIARDTGPERDQSTYAYTAAYWEGDKFNSFKSELRIHGLKKTPEGDKAPKDRRFGTGEDFAVLKPAYKIEIKTTAGTRKRLGGLAVYNGILAASNPANEQLLFIDVRAGKAVGLAEVPNIGGIAFDAQGRLWVVSGTHVLRFDKLPAMSVPAETPELWATSNTPAVKLPAAVDIIVAGLEEPQQLTIHSDGRVFVTDWGKSHQVKVFSPEGKPLGTIGLAGAPTVGKYDERKMHRPKGLAIDANDRLWVAENDYLPKRISVWSLDGKLYRAFYGPPTYGAGGTIDPEDKSRFFASGMEFHLDWKTGDNAPVAVYGRSGDDPLKPLVGERHSVPATPFHRAGKTYLTDSYTVSPVEGIANSGLWILEDGKIRPVAYVGQANEVTALNPTRNFAARWVGQIQPATAEEYTFYTSSTHGSRLWIDGKPLIQNWRSWGGDSSAKVTLEAGKRYDIIMEIYNDRGSAHAQLSWSTATIKKQIVPKEQLFAKDAAAGAAGAGLTATYFSDRNFKEAVETRVEGPINFNWGLTGLKFSNESPLRARLPKGADLGKENYILAWSDLNDDGQVQPEEVTVAKGSTGSVTFQPDFSALTATALRLKPKSFTPGGAPVYDANDAEPLLKSGATQKPVSDGGGQALLDDRGNLLLTTAPKPFAPTSLGGATDGIASWSYPSLWPGLHASHIGALVDTPGTLIGTTRLISTPFSPAGSQVAPLFAINGNKGVIYVMTTDGLFVAQLFRDCRTASWSAPQAVRGMSVKDLSLNEECFYPTLTATTAGEVYIQGGGRIMQVLGLDSLRPIAPIELPVTAEQLAAAQKFSLEQEAERQKKLADAGVTRAVIPSVKTAPTVDGKLDDWKDAKWLTIDERTIQVGDWGKRKVVTAAAVCVAEDRLYLAIKTDRPDLLKNTGEVLQNLFKTGGGIDLMLGTDPKADPNRRNAVAGDLRLMIAQVDNKPVAVLFRPVVPGTKGEPVAYASPIRTVKFDRVEDVSEHLKLATTSELDEKNTVKQAVFELSFPLAQLQLKPLPQGAIRADVGVLRGNGFQALQRSYWANKATGLMSDMTYEAELTPALWGTWTFAEP